MAMKLFLERVQKHRFGLLFLLTLILVGTSFITRVVLFIDTPKDAELSLISVLEAFFIGFFFDLVTASYFIIPMLFYLWICPERLYHKKWHKYVLNSLLFFFTALLIFNSFSEFFFWEEFTTRFNFIAVDYLVYTTEVIGNIQQSYPVELYFGIALAVTAAIVYYFRSWTTH